jgi:NADH:ubiquinone oxidoreductase subunit 6 (subunit J)
MSNTQFGIQVAIYAGLVVGYFFLVVSLLQNRIKDLFDQQKVIYAVVAWALIAGQGVVLEIIAVMIHRLVRKKIG